MSPAHRHVPLKGSRDGQDVTRCTEAGAYAWDFVNAVVSVLQTTLGVGGGPGFTNHNPMDMQVANEGARMRRLRLLAAKMSQRLRTQRQRLKRRSMTVRRQQRTRVKV